MAVLHTEFATKLRRDFDGALRYVNDQVWSSRLGPGHTMSSAQLVLFAVHISERQHWVCCQLIG